MAGGGVKKPINVFRLGALGEPTGVFNWRLWFTVFSFGLLGAARGIDEGLITGAFNSTHFQHLIRYDTLDAGAKADLKGNISSMVLLGSVAGSLLYVRSPVSLTQVPSLSVTESAGSGPRAS